MKRLCSWGDVIIVEYAKSVSTKRWPKNIMYCIAVYFLGSLIHTPTYVHIHIPPNSHSHSTPMYIHIHIIIIYIYMMKPKCDFKNLCTKFVCKYKDCTLCKIEKRPKFEQTSPHLRFFLYFLIKIEEFQRFVYFFTEVFWK